MTAMSVHVPDELAPAPLQKQSPLHPGISKSPPLQADAASSTQRARCPLPPQGVARTQVPEASPPALQRQSPEQNGISKSPSSQEGRRSRKQHARSPSPPQGVGRWQIPI